MNFEILIVLFAYAFSDGVGFSTYLTIRSKSKQIRKIIKEADEFSPKDELGPSPRYSADLDLRGKRKI